MIIFVGMKKVFYIFIAVFIVLISCQSKVKNDQMVVDKQDKYANVKDEIRVFDTLPSVALKYNDSIVDWKGYLRVKETLRLIKKTSANEVLSTAEVLVKDIVSMRDSIPMDVMEQKGMSARLNGLYNQALRLQEMQEIPAITMAEIAHQTQGLFVLFNTINKKVNAIYDQIDFENKMIEDDFVFSVQDSIF